MKTVFLSAFLILFIAGVAKASDNMRPFALTSDYSTFIHLAENNVVNQARTVLNDANPYEKKEMVTPVEKSKTDDDEKWNSVKDLKNKPRSVSGEASFDANDRVSVGAFAGYTFPEEADQNQNKLNEAYSLTINVKVAL